jgi:hypothetical protein
VVRPHRRQRRRGGEQPSRTHLIGASPVGDIVTGRTRAVRTNDAPYG